MKLSSLLPNPMQVICIKGPFKPEVIKEAAAEQLPVKEYARMLWDTVTAGNDESKKWDMDLIVKEYGLDQTSIDEINTELDVMKARLTSISLAPTPSLDERIQKQSEGRSMEDGYSIHAMVGGGQERSQNFIDDNNIDAQKLIAYIEQNIRTNPAIRYDVRDYISGAPGTVGGQKHLRDKFIKQFQKARLTSISLAPTPSLDERIQKQGSDYVVKPSKGDKVLGTHETKKAALKQVAAIEISKAKRK